MHEIRPPFTWSLNGFCVCVFVLDSLVRHASLCGNCILMISFYANSGRKFEFRSNGSWQVAVLPLTHWQILSGERCTSDGWWLHSTALWGQPSSYSPTGGWWGDYLSCLHPTEWRKKTPSHSLLTIKIPLLPRRGHVKTKSWHPARSHSQGIKYSTPCLVQTQKLSGWDTM